MNNTTLWQTKLAARLHDPAEKALVLLRDPAGHEGGSIVSIGKALGFDTHMVRRPDGSAVEKLHLPKAMEAAIKKADHWASAADRAQFPKDAKQRFVGWAQVRFAEEGELIHPLSGEKYTVPKIGQDILTGHIKQASTALFKDLIQVDANGKPDDRLTNYAFWRFGSEQGRFLQGIGALWSLLPADTRVPDHSIWQHLDLTSALAGAMSEGATPALLTVSIGPVQSFIAMARSTSDLWAGSHFLSTLAWQGIRHVAERLGPDVLVFPQLRGIPQVDLWLMEQGVKRELFDLAEWNDSNSDYNPLFVAGMPNKFVAIVPQHMGEQLAKDIQKTMRDWVLNEARAMLDRVLEEIGERPSGQHCYQQLEQQLTEFPEVHWSLVPWMNVQNLESSLSPFYGHDEPGMFGKDAWKNLKQPIEPEQNWQFWQPNDGTLYPAVHDLGDRALAAAKATRSFLPLEQNGYRDSLSGENEWLTLDEKQLGEGSPRQRTDTLWARLARKRPSWCKGDQDGRKAEHLSAFGLIKRLWPERYMNWLQDQGFPIDSRFVISTHTMALSPVIKQLTESEPADAEAFRQLASETDKLKRTALPRGLMAREVRQSPRWLTASRLPALLEDAVEYCDEGEDEKNIDTKRRLIERASGKKLETYYGMILMDGDQLGAWLSGEKTLSYAQSFHTKIREGLKSYNDERLHKHLTDQRLSSPARHMAISGALNGFALDLVRHVVEEESLGKLLYAGGDDVMAMTTTTDLLRTMGLLRAVYSGSWPDNIVLADEHNMKLEGGFVLRNKRLYQVMGKHATASTGAVVAHHQAPLSAVLRELRTAEKRAKSEGGRDAFSITIIKRSGGALRLTAKWGEPLRLLSDLISYLRNEDTSRRAVYHTLEWLRNLPWPKGEQAMLESLLTYQLKRQSQGDTAKTAPDLANCLAKLTVNHESERMKHHQKTMPDDKAAKKAGEETLIWLANVLTVAEFLARETRTGGAE